MAEPDSFRVNPSNSLLPLLEAPTPDNAAPGQLAKLGGAVQEVGGRAAGVFADMLREQNTARALEAMTELNDEATRLRVGEDGQGGYVTQLGRNALERPNGKSLEDEYDELLGKKIEDITTRLGNDAQRKAFVEQATRLRGQFREGLRTHVIKQAHQYNVDVRTASVGSAVRQLSLSGGDAEQIETARALIRNQIKGGEGFNGLQQLLGMDAETAEQKVQEALSLGHLAVAEALDASGDYGALEEYFKKYAGDLTTDAYAKISATVAQGTDLVRGEKLASTVYRQHIGGTDGTPARPAEVIPPIAGSWIKAKSSPFGPRGGRNHNGADIAVPIGTPLRAGADGTVRFKNDPRGYGKYAELTLDDGKTVIRLAHLSEFGRFKDGDRVRQGDIIGKSGNTGRSTGPHAHYEVRVNGKPVDPEDWHAGRPSAPAAGNANATLNRVAMLDRLNQLADEQQLSPRARKAAEARLRDYIGAHEADKRDREQADEDAAWAAARDGKPIPASIAARNPRLAIRIDEYRRQLASRGSNPLDPQASRDAYYSAVWSMVENGPPKSLGELEVLRPTMNADDFQAFTEQATRTRAANRAAVGDISGYARVFSAVEDEVIAVGGFDTKDGKLSELGKKSMNAFRGLVTEIILQEEQNLGKPTTEARRREIILGQAYERSKFMSQYTSASALQSAYDDIPAGTRESIRRDLRQQTGGRITVTQGMVLREWQRRQGQK